MARLLTLLLLVALWGCDTAPPGPILGAETLTLRLVGGAYPEGTGDPFVPVGIPDCFYTPEGGQAHRLEAGELQLHPEGDFELTLVGQRFPYDETPPETLRVAGTYEHFGSLLRLAPEGAPIWFATVGPGLTAPSTLVLADYSPNGTSQQLGSGRCRQLIFSNGTAAPDRSVRGGAEAAAFDLAEIHAFGTTLGLPYRFGRLANNRYDSARLELRPDGAYRFTMWQLAGHPYVRDDTAHVAGVSEGRYVRQGPLYAFDPGTARMAFGVDETDRLMIYHNYFDLSLGQQGDLLWRRR